MKILVTTTNPHKLDEIRSVFDAETAARGIDWPSFDKVCRGFDGGIAEPVEDQPTFEGNAALKARYYAQKTGRICLADDSGIEVDALDGRPGVRSARYSGQTGPRSEVDPANNAKLLEELAAVPPGGRTARFVCAMCLVVPAHQREQVPGEAYDRLARAGDAFAQLIVRGTVEGRILLPEEADDPARPEKGRGAHGFGYDPLFLLPDRHEHAGLTTAQLTETQKNAISHRGHASRLMLAEMQSARLI